MFGALGQYENLPALLVRFLDFRNNRNRPLNIIGEMLEHVLNTRFLWQVDALV